MKPALLQSFSPEDYDRMSVQKNESVSSQEDPNEFSCLRMLSLRTRGTFSKMLTDTQENEVLACELRGGLNVKLDHGDSGYRCMSCDKDFQFGEMQLEPENSSGGRFHWFCFFGEANCCAKCLKPIKCGNSIWSVNGQPHHDKCFTCAGCKETIMERIYHVYCDSHNSVFPNPQSWYHQCIFHRTCVFCFYCEDQIASSEDFFCHYWWPHTFLCISCASLESCDICSRKVSVSGGCSQRSRFSSFSRLFSSSELCWSEADSHSRSSSRFGKALSLCNGCELAQLATNVEEAHECLQKVLSWIVSSLGDFPLPSPHLTATMESASGDNFVISLEPQYCLDEKKALIGSMGGSLQRLPSRRSGYKRADLAKYAICEEINPEPGSRLAYELLVCKDAPKPVLEVALAVSLAKKIFDPKDEKKGGRVRCPEGMARAIAWTFAVQQMVDTAAELKAITSQPGGIKANESQARMLEAQHALFEHLTRRFQMSDHPIHGSATRKVRKAILAFGLRPVAEFFKLFGKIPRPD